MSVQTMQSIVDAMLSQYKEYGIPVAFLVGCSMFSEQEYQTNGKLMAAAPKMYQELKHLVKFVDAAGMQFVNVKKYIGREAGANQPYGKLISRIRTLKQHTGHRSPLSVCAVRC